MASTKKETGAIDLAPLAAHIKRLDALEVEEKPDWSRIIALREAWAGDVWWLEQAVQDRFRSLLDKTEPPVTAGSEKKPKTRTSNPDTLTALGYPIDVRFPVITDPPRDIAELRLLLESPTPIGPMKLVFSDAVLAEAMSIQENGKFDLRADVAMLCSLLEAKSTDDPEKDIAYLEKRTSFNYGTVAGALNRLVKGGFIKHNAHDGEDRYFVA